jgi:hypothetical protein
VKIASCIAVLVLACFLSGCGPGHPKTAPVRGTVFFDGKPVPNGTIMLVPATGNSATGEIQPDGSFTLTTFQNGDGAIPAEYKVVIIARQDTSSRLPEERNPLPPIIVPIQYTSAATSPLRAEIKDQENVLELRLSRDGL